MLLQCRDCENQISKDAKYCPHCGTPDPILNKESYHKMKNRFWGLFALILMFIPMCKATIDSNNNQAWSNSYGLFMASLAIIGALIIWKKNYKKRVSCLIVK